MCVKLAIWIKVPGQHDYQTQHKASNFYLVVLLLPTICPDWRLHWDTKGAIQTHNWWSNYRYKSVQSIPDRNNKLHIQHVFNCFEANSYCFDLTFVKFLVEIFEEKKQLPKILKPSGRNIQNLGGNVSLQIWLWAPNKPSCPFVITFRWPFCGHRSPVENLIPLCDEVSKFDWSGEGISDEFSSNDSAENILPFQKILHI